MPTLSSLVAPQVVVTTTCGQVVVTTTCGATSDGKFATMTILHFQRLYLMLSHDKLYQYLQDMK